MKLRNYLSYYIFILFALISCSETSTTEENNNDYVEGSWVSGEILLSFSDGEFSYTSTTNGNLEITGKYNVGNEVLTTDGIKAKEIDFISETELEMRCPFDIVYVDSNILYLGASNLNIHCDSPSKRPDALSFKGEWLKQ